MKCVTNLSAGLSGKRTMQTLRINPAEKKKIGESNKVFRIFDLRGQLLGQIIVTSEEDTGMLNLNLSSLPQGVYFVQLIGKKKSMTGKIFKQ